jgi:KipI family sensor histidine kinase inhibitor
MASRSIPVGEIRLMGDHAVLIGVRDAVAARDLVRVMKGSHLDGVVEVVGGQASVLVVFDTEGEDPDRLRPRVTQLMEQSLRRSRGEGGEGGQGDGDGAAVVEAGQLVEISSVFEGPDLNDVATSAGCTPETVSELVTAATFTVAFVGFSPGFAYLEGLPHELRRIGRRARPRPAVPAGSIALANGHAAVYPAASPGGWHLIGHTDEPLFSPWAAPYARLAPGDRVRFTTSPGESRVSRIADSHGVPEGESYPAAARPVFQVEETGLWTVVQDSGRHGFAALGVPAASPADPISFALANQLVGNRPGSAALEVTALGPTLRCLTPAFVAVVGGSPDLRLQGQPIAPGRVVPVGAGQQLTVGPVRGGLRTYVAVAGGFLGPEVLGSRSSDQLSGLGPGPVVRGARLWAGAMEPPLGDHVEVGMLAGVTDGPTALRVVPGPHGECFAPGTFESLATIEFTVEADSNRVGLRLRRDPQAVPVVRSGTNAADSELDSQGMVTGAVQVPPNGEPVILLTDHATLGGYPVVAVVAAADHGALGQCAPGATVVLVPIDHAQARAALRRQRRLLDDAVIGHYPFAVE